MNQVSMTLKTYKYIIQESLNIQKMLLQCRCCHALGHDPRGDLNKQPPTTGKMPSQILHKFTGSTCLDLIRKKTKHKVRVVLINTIPDNMLNEILQEVNSPNSSF